MMSPWNRSWKWNPRWNVQQVPWSLKSKTLLPHQDLCSWLTGVCIASLLGLLIGSACSFFFFFLFKKNIFINLSTRKSTVTTAFIQAAVELWLHHQVNTSGFGYGCTLWWLFCQPGGGTNDFLFVAPLGSCNLNFYRWFQEDNYVLSMLWLGVPVKMMCPQVRPCSSNPPMVACYAEGMVVKMDWPLTDIKVNGKFKKVLM